MRVFTAETTNEMMQEVYPALIQDGIFDDSRNGDVLKFDTPCTFVYTRPQKRVNLCGARDCNPFFHLMEGILMLGWHNCVKCMSKYTSQIAQYSDDGKTFNAFYGTRIHFHDQFARVATLLADDPGTRQAVVAIWDDRDLDKDTLDKACNISMVFKVDSSTKSQLNMVLFNRSNDLIYGGVSGANIVHFSMFHEVMAALIGKKQGTLTHVVCDAHVYTSNPHYRDFYKFESVASPHEPVPIDVNSFDFLKEVKHLCEDIHTFRGALEPVYESNFLNTVVVPVHNVWANRYHGKDYDTTLIADLDWRFVVEQWLEKRDEA